MRELKKLVKAYVGDFSELSNMEKDLICAAAEARKNAQTPYYKFKVGVAVLSRKGNVYTGCNVERCTGTQTTHAEQSAVDRMIDSEGPTKILEVALVAAPSGTKIVLPPKKTGDPISRIEDVLVPCGHCLQIIWENCYEDPNVKLIALAQNGEVVCTTIGDALPIGRFGPKALGVDYNQYSNE